MGFFDTVKEKAAAIAGDAERAGKVTAAQARLVVLQNDLRKAERELGQAVMALVEAGETVPPQLAATVASVQATLAEIRAKEAEIAALRTPAGHRDSITVEVVATATAEPAATTAEPAVITPEPAAAAPEPAAVEEAPSPEPEPTA